MKENATRAAALLLFTIFGGCASMPKVTIGYYESKVDLEIRVTQTATCTDGNVPVLVNQVDFQPRYSSNTQEKLHEVDLSKLGSIFSKGDAAFEFFPDGRLKSINSKQTGQAEEVLGAAVKLASTFVAAAVLLPEKATLQTACGALMAAVGKDKALTIIHEGSSDFANSFQFNQMSVTPSEYETLKPIFGTIMAGYTIKTPAIVHRSNDEDEDRVLNLVEPANVVVEVTIIRGPETATFSHTVLVPQHGVAYTLPIQKAPWFGENTVELTLDESGKATKIGYSGGGGSTGAIGVLSDVRTAAAAEKTAAKAAGMEAEANLIYQQQRLVLCQTTPENCPK